MASNQLGMCVCFVVDSVDVFWECLTCSPFITTGCSHSLEIGRVTSVCTAKCQMLFALFTSLSGLVSYSEQKSLDSVTVGCVLLRDVPDCSQTNTTVFGLSEIFLSCDKDLLYMHSCSVCYWIKTIRVKSYIKYTLGPA